MNSLELHPHVWQQLAERRNRLPHALLFSGQKGLGKAALASQYAASLLCESPRADGRHCMECLACNWFSQGNHPDFRLVQPGAMADEGEGEGEEAKKKASQQITVDQVRSLDEFFNVGTHRGGLRIILINPAEAMNRNAANSLLKTLEEPGPGTLFLLVSHEPKRLLPTIRSRCQVVPVALPSAELAVTSLTRAGIEEPARWLALAGGSPGIALELASSGQGAWLDLLTRHLLAGRMIDPLTSALEIEKVLKESKGRWVIRHVVEAVQKWLVDLNLARCGLPVRYFLPMRVELQGLAAMIPPARLIRSYRAAVSRRREAEQPLNQRLFLEGLFLDYRALFAS